MSARMASMIALLAGSALLLATPTVALAGSSASGGSPGSDEYLDAVREAALLNGEPAVIRAKFAGTIPGDGTPYPGAVLWLDLEGDITRVDAVFTTCPENCSNFSLPITSTKRIGVKGFTLWCLNPTSGTTVFGVDLIPFDAQGHEGVKLTVFFNCTPAGGS